MNDAAVTRLKQLSCLSNLESMFKVHRATGTASCFRSWIGMVITKKALGAAWVAQRKALAKIEAVKSMELKSIMNQERAQKNKEMSDIEGANKKNAALSSLKNVLRKLLNSEKIGAFTKFKIHFYVDRALREDAAGQQANLQEAVQAATFETELRRKQVGPCVWVWPGFHILAAACSCSVCYDR